MNQQSLRSLKKLKPTVLRGRDLEIESSGTEVRELTKQKGILLADIKRLGEVYFGLKKAKEESEKKFDDYTTGRVMSLEYIAREVSDELAVRAQELSSKLQKFRKHEADFRVVRNIQIRRESGLEARESEVKADKLISIGNSIDTRQQEISKMQGKLGGKMSTLAKKEKEIDEVYDKAQKLVTFFETEADKEREALKKEEANIKRRELEVVAERVAIDIRSKKELTRRKTYIRNREAIVRMLIGNFGLDKDKIPKHLKK